MPTLNANGINIFYELHGILFANGARYDDKREVRVHALFYPECPLGVEGRKVEVGKDDVRFEVRERRFKIGFRLDYGVFIFELIFPQLMPEQIDVHVVVFNN